MASGSTAAPSLFLRNATGLVKGWSGFDAFTYSFMSVNFVTLGLFFSLAVIAYVPTGQILPALLISGVFISFMVVTYAGLISVMLAGARRKKNIRWRYKANAMPRSSSN